MKSPSITRFLLFLFCFAALEGAAQENKYPALLWRISGHGLTKPSYLYGTIHVTDRQVFYFSDSLYHALENAGGYAMEIDADTAFTTLLRSIFAPDSSGPAKNTLKSEAFTRMAKRLEAEMGIPADKVTKKQLWLYSLKGGRSKKADDMDSPMDTYLYNIAKRQGKWVGGIEDLEDQMPVLDSMESRFETDPLLYNATGKTGTDQLTAIYKSQDLDRLEAWMVHGTDSAYREQLLYHRNIKMARRIDSLAGVRNTFFAIGAGHLPGKKGVISLLRARGYTLTPVRSSKKIAPEAYTYKAIELPWQTIQDADTSYTVQMPGKPFPIQLKGVSMQCYADIGSGLYYFMMSMPYPARTVNSDTLLTLIAKNMAQNGSMERQGPIVYNGVRGMEVLAVKSGYRYLVHTFLKGNGLYIAMVGSSNKALLDGAECRRFFNSLVMNDHYKANKKKINWTSFTLPGKGFAVSFPGKPMHDLMEEKRFRKDSNSVNWSFQSYEFIDFSSGDTYMLYVKEPKPGYILTSDTGSFNDVKRNLEASGHTILSCDTFTQQGYGAVLIKTDYQHTHGVDYLAVCTGSRLYAILAVWGRRENDTATVNRFIHSFHLLDKQRAEWSEQAAPDGSFHAWEPSPISRGDSAQGGSLIGYDSLNAVSLTVNKTPVSAYYWTKSDSSFFADIVAKYKEDEDSLVGQQPVTNGTIGGMEYFFRRGGAHRIKRVRLLPHEDSVYVLNAFLHEQQGGDTDISRFFSSFRFVKEKPGRPWLESKAKTLLADLQSTDSATREQAREGLLKASFSKEDLPWLHEALLHSYKNEDDEPIFSLYRTIAKATADLHDSTTLSFIATQYPLLQGDKESIKYPLLSVLAIMNTSASYGLLKRLLQQQPPRAGDPYNLSYCLTDSLSLTASLFPDLLPLSGDTLFVKILPQVLMALADSNQLSIAMLAPYKKNFYAAARNELLHLATGDWTSQSLFIVRLLGQLNDAEGNALLQKFLLSKPIEIREEAVLALVKNNQPVSPVQIERIAADRRMRAGLYNDLLAIKKQKIFPAAWYNQKSFAESDLSQLIDTDTDDTASIRFIGERTGVFKGKKRIFYLFKISYRGEEGALVSHLGIAGPYIAGSKPVVSGSGTFINLEDTFDAKQLPAQFKKTLRLSEEDRAESEDDNEED